MAETQAHKGEAVLNWLLVFWGVGVALFGLIGNSHTTLEGESDKFQLIAGFGAAIAVWQLNQTFDWFGLNRWVESIFYLMLVGGSLWLFIPIHHFAVKETGLIAAICVLAQYATVVIGFAFLARAAQEFWKVEQAVEDLSSKYSRHRD